MKGLIFDLDGTLVDTVYGHVLAWREALAKIGVEVSSAHLHARIGMAGDLLMKEAAREAGVTLSPSKAKAAERSHDQYFAKIIPRPRPLTGAVQLLKALRRSGVPHGIATSGKRQSIEPALKSLKLPANIVVIDGSAADQAKPEPDLFVTCRQRLALSAADCFVVGDAIWDMLAARRAGLLAVGLLTGGRGEDELYRAGAFRVYQNTAELLHSLEHLGFTV